MSKSKNDKEKFEKYLKQELDQKESHQFERSVLHDNFEQEALDGLESIEAETALKDIKFLQGKVLSKKKRAGWLSIAAAITLIIVGSFSIWMITDNIREPELIVQEIKPEIVTQEQPEEAEIEEIEVIEDLEEGPIVPETIQIEKNKEVKPSIKFEEPSSIAFKTTADEPESELDNAHFEVDENYGDDSLDEVEADVAPLSEIAQATQAEPEIEEVQTQARSARSSISKRSQTEEPSGTRLMIRGTSTLSIPREGNQIKGKISDEYGNAIPGAIVLINGTTSGTATDSDGNFELTAKPEEELVVTYIGYEQEVVPVGQDSTLDISLSESSTELSEVVVTSTSDETNFIKAKPSDGNKAYRKYLENNLNYPQEATTNGIEGTVLLSVKINSVGFVENISVKKGLGYGCDEEAIRLVKEGPIWIPAKRNGISVDDEVRIKVKFR